MNKKIHSTFSLRSVIRSFLLVSLIVVVQCSQNRTRPEFNQRGFASWYGKQFQGKKMAGGERFNMYALTAAHRSLPLGSLVRVKSLSTGRTVIVKITDRGPYSGSRIIDLSYGAARRLGILNKGVDEVEIQLESSPSQESTVDLTHLTGETPSSMKYALQHRHRPLRSA